MSISDERLAELVGWYADNPIGDPLDIDVEDMMDIDVEKALRELQILRARGATPLREAVVALLAKMDQITPNIVGAQAAHGVIYRGPDWGAERDAVDAALATAPPGREEVADLLDAFDAACARCCGFHAANESEAALQRANEECETLRGRILDAVCGKEPGA